MSKKEKYKISIYYFTGELLNRENSNTLQEEVGTIIKNKILAKTDYRCLGEVERKLIKNIPYRNKRENIH